jgi:hypothetical protein
MIFIDHVYHLALLSSCEVAFGVEGLIFVSVITGGASPPGTTITDPFNLIFTFGLITSQEYISTPRLNSPTFLVLYVATTNPFRPA